MHCSFSCGKLVCFSDQSLVQSFQHRLELNDVLLRASPSSVDVMAHALCLSLMDTVVLELLTIPSLSMNAARLPSHWQWTTTLNEAQCTIDMAKQHLVALFIEQLRYFVFTSTPPKADSSEIQENGTPPVLTPILDVSLVLLSPRLVLQQLPLQGECACSSVRWILAVERDATRRQPMPYRLTFWLTMDAMAVNYHQQRQWRSFLAASHLNFVTILQTQPLLIDSEASMHTPVVYLLENDALEEPLKHSKHRHSRSSGSTETMMPTEPLLYWQALFAPMSSMLSSLTTPSRAPRQEFTVAHLLQHCAAHYHMYDAKVVLHAIDPPDQHAIYRENTMDPPPSPPATDPYGNNMLDSHLDNRPAQPIAIQLAMAWDRVGITMDRGHNGLSLSMHQVRLSRVVNVDPQEIEKTDALLMAWVSHVTLGLQWQPKNVVCRVTLHKLAICYTLGHHYALLTTTTAAQRVAAAWIDNWKQMDTVHAMENGENAKSSTKWLPPQTTMSVQADIQRLDVHLVLPDAQHQLYLRLSNLCWQSTRQSLDMACIALFGQATTHPKRWQLLVQADQTRLEPSPPYSSSSSSSSNEKAKNDENTPWLAIDAARLLVRLPHGFVVHGLIDQAINLVKALKELHNAPRFTFNGPVANNDPINVPSIHARCAWVHVRIDDDPLEARLRRIFRAQQQFPPTRASSSLTSTTTSASSSSSNNEPSLTLSSSSSSVHPSTSNSSAEASSPSSTGVANASLLSTRWIHRLRRLRQQEHDHQRQLLYEQGCFKGRDKGKGRQTSNNGVNGSKIYKNASGGNDDDDNLLSDLVVCDFSDEFQLQCVPLPLDTPLATCTVANASLNMASPTTAEMDPRLFIHHVGRNVPLDLDYAFVIPLIVNWSAGETLVRLRDYPVPMLHIPPPVASSSSSSSTNDHPKSWAMTGRYVIADDLGISDGKRHVCLNLVPGYDLIVVRTASPTKFYSQVHYHVLTKHLVLLSWAIAYQPALACLLACLDAILPLTVDPSLKPRFCDKLRLMIHTQCKVALAGDLCLILKGTTSPYTLTDSGAGLAKLWHGNVQCFLGHPNLQQELLQVHSRDCLFGVPDLASVPIIGHYHHGNSLPFTPTTTPLHFTFTKIAIKLFGGVQMGIGCHLEPLGHARLFKPHYHVVFKSPEYADAQHDAYAGFRSHGTHLSFSIIQRRPLHGEGDERNGMHLTPDFMAHFLQWYDLFGGPMNHVPLRLPYVMASAEKDAFLASSSEPITCMSPPLSDEQLGKHMQSLKYKIDVAPMAFSLFCRTGDAAMVGLKARVDHFTLDIHQRRKTADDDELARVNSSWPLHHAEIQLTHVDIRAIHNIAGGVVNHELPPPFPWMDPDDWVDLDTHYRLQPPLVVRALPFASSPFVVYTRQLDPKFIKHHRHLNDTHACIIGAAKPAHVTLQDQAYQRMDKMDALHRHHQHLLEAMEAQLARSPYSSELQEKCNETMATLQALDTRRRLLKQYMEAMGSGASSLGGFEDGTSVEAWEQLMGRFKECYTVHQPHIVWTTAIHEVIHRWLEARAQQKIHAYNVSSRAIHTLQSLIDQAIGTTTTTTATTTTGGASFSSPLSSSPDALLEQHPSNSQNMQQQTATRFTQDLLRLFMQPAHVDNETQQQKAQKEPKSTNPPNQNANDPHHHLASMSSDHVCDSMTLFDLWHPQVYLQSVSSEAMNPSMPNHCTTRHLHNHLPRHQQQEQQNEQPGVLLVANHRVQVKQLAISERDNMDMDTGLVKKRTIASLNGLQLFVVQHGPMDRVEKLLDIDAFDTSPQITLSSSWLPPELVHLPEKHRDALLPCRFYRFDSKIEGTMQFDRINPVRLAAAAKGHHGNDDNDDENEEDDALPSNTTQFHFPSFSIAADPYQYSVLSRVIMDLVLARKVSKSQRESPRLSDRLLSFHANGHSLHQVLSEAMALQALVREHAYHYTLLGSLDPTKRKQDANFQLTGKIASFDGNNAMDALCSSFSSCSSSSSSSDDASMASSSSTAHHHATRQQQHCQDMQHHDLLWRVTLDRHRRQWHQYQDQLRDLMQSIKYLLRRSAHTLQQHARTNDDDNENDENAMSVDDAWHVLQRGGDPVFLSSSSMSADMDKAIKRDRRDEIDEKDDDNPLLPVEKIQVAIDSLVWTMRTADGDPFSQWAVSNTNYVRMVYKNKNLQHTLDIDKLLVTDTSPNPAFRHVLAPYLATINSSTARKKKKKDERDTLAAKMPKQSDSLGSQRRIAHDFSRHKMIHARLESMPPVAGIPIIQHLEINLFPLHLQITYAFWRALLTYLFPKPLTASLSSSSSSVSVMPPPPQAATPTMSSSTPLAGSINAFRASASAPTTPTATTAYDRHHHAALPHRTHPSAAQLTALNTFSAENTLDAADSARPRSSLSASSSRIHRMSFPPRLDLSLIDNKSTNDDERRDDDVSIMKQRASTTRSFILIKIPGVEHCLSFKGKKAIYNLHNFRFKQPSLEYRNKCCSWYELLQLLKKDFRRSVIRHGGKLLKEKLTPRRRSSKQIDMDQASLWDDDDENGEIDEHAPPMAMHGQQSSSGLSRNSTDDTMRTAQSSVHSMISGSGSGESSHHAENPTYTSTDNVHPLDIMANADDDDDLSSSSSDHYRDDSSSTTTNESLEHLLLALDGDASDHALEDDDEDDDDDDNDLVSLHSDNSENQTRPLRRSFTR
ncbi:golgi-body localization protein domain-containing protein [Gongronella butleri]|nr:golgi-body localization protein domain-containing protein [Gongronella butleri]